MVQESPQGSLTYKLIKEEGPDHDKSFQVEAYVNGEAISRGAGRTKKAAEQQAANNAILLLRGQEENK